MNGRPMTSSSADAALTVPASGEWDFGDYPYGLEPLTLTLPHPGTAWMSDGTADGSLAGAHQDLLAAADAGSLVTTPAGPADMERLFWFRWIIGHHVSFIIWRLLAGCLVWLAAGEGDERATSEAITRYVRAYSAMLIYTGSSTQQVYNDTIRPSMYRLHSTFSGTWSADYVAVRGLFRGRNLPPVVNSETEGLAREISLSHQIHLGVAAKLVVGGRSLLQDLAGHPPARQPRMWRAIFDAYFLTVRAPVSGHDILVQLLRRCKAVVTDRGLLTGTDMASWRAAAEPPVSLEYRGLLVHKPGPWSQGPVFLQQLALLSGFDLGSVDFGSADHIHTVVEAAKLAFADREAWYGDPDKADVPMAGLLDTGYSAARRALIGAQASTILRPGSPDGREPWIPPVLDALAEPGRGGHEPAEPDWRGQMAWLAEGHNNALAPGKRPRTTLSPTIVLRDDGRPCLAFGTPGGDQQDQWTLNFFTGHVDFGMSPQHAVEALAFHTEHVPTSFTPRQFRPLTVVTEQGVDSRTVAELRRRGHDVTLTAPMSLGKVCVTGLDTDGGVFAAASPRGQQAYGAVR